jgi:hypothetical protein
MWKEAVIARFEELAQHLPGGTEQSDENPIRIVDLRAKILTIGFLYTKQECSLLRSSFR